MRPGVFPILAAALLAGCGSQAAANNPSPTPSPNRTATSGAPTPDPSPTRAAVPTLGPAHVTASMSPYQRGLAYVKVRDYKNAAREFKASILAHRDVTASYVGLAASALASGDYLNAYQNYVLASNRAPTNASYLYYAAFSAYYAGDYHDSIPYATRFIALQPNNPAGYHLRFLDYGGLTMAKQQLKDAQMVARLQPHNASAYNDLAIAYTNNRRFAQSQQTFTRAIQLARTVPQYYLNRARVDLLLKQTKAAIQDFKKARSLTTDPVTREQLQAAIIALEKTLGK
jgi:tetratricopeptide (TPR) repeat protein